MRRVAFAAAFVAALGATGCGNKTKTVTQTAPGQTVTVTTPESTSTPTGTTPSQTGGEFRKPVAGEGQVTIGATLATGELRKTGNQPSDFAQYIYLELAPNDGGKVLRVAAAGDLALPPGAANAFVNPACRGKLHGTFKVTPAPARVTDYDWELLSVTLPSAKCGGP
ncbi:MAG: hypothetical protein QOK04_2835 [Solirubrobacteraceae bacterium]|jgi:hypothetical protein|nr:hypothetical protein [Solirubrobacteraceae bacterium]